MTTVKDEFWNRMEKVRACMLGTDGQLVPMSPQVDDDFPGHIWFITANGTSLAQAAETGQASCRLVVSDTGAGLYADVAGKLSRSMDSEALDEVWSKIADAWFEDGQYDPNVRLLQFTPEQGDVTVASNGASFLYEIVKANLTGEKPDVGEQQTVTF